MNHSFKQLITASQNPSVLKRFRVRRKGAVMVEFLTSMPLFFFLAWITWQILFLASSISTAQNAALDGAHFLATELRGFNGNQLNEVATSADLQQELKARMNLMTAYNGVFLLFHDQTSARDPLVIWGDESACRAAFTNNANKSVICAYLNPNPTYSDVKVVNVAVKGEYWVLGNFIPTLQGTLFAKGYGYAILDNPDRYQYFQP